LLGDLKSAIEDVRTQLAGKRKDLYTVEEVADLTGRFAVYRENGGFLSTAFAPFGSKALARRGPPVGAARPA